MESAEKTEKNTQTQKKVIVFTDGASRGNPGPGGWGAIIAYNSSVCELGGASPKTTNNRMELMAVIEALQFLKAQSHTETPAHFFVDSEYVIKGARFWLTGWINNGWKTKNGGAVLNRDLWEVLATLLQDFSIT